MKNKQPNLASHYLSALRAYLAHPKNPPTKLIDDISAKTSLARLTTLQLAKLHESIIALEFLPQSSPRQQSTMVRKASDFFNAVNTATNYPDLLTHPLRETIASLTARNEELDAENRKLNFKARQQTKLEADLRKGQNELTEALKKSEALREQLSGLSRSVLSVQEEERRKISRELHDVVAQALAGINVRLATIKTEAGMNLKILLRNITIAQKMVTRSAEIVHRFARELRPAALDDLGLIPALHSFLKSFTTRSGVRASLTAFEGLEDLNSAKRTVLYRVAQEALTNVERHAHASRVTLTISKDHKFVRMEIQDNGRSFEVQEVLLGRKSKRLGLLGMRERVEMVRGSFEIESSPSEGTTVIALIPVGRALEKQWREKSSLSK